MAGGLVRKHGGLEHFWASGLRHFAWNSLGAHLDENLRLADNRHTPFWISVISFGVGCSTRLCGLGWDFCTISKWMDGST